MVNKITGTVERVERLGTSIYGNPYFKVAIVTHEGDVTIVRTQIDSSINYAINNPEFKDKEHTFLATSAFRIYGTQ